MKSLVIILKKVLIIGLVVVVTVSAAACGDSSSNDESIPLNDRPYAHEEPLPIEDEEATVEMFDVDSSCFSEIGYDEDNGILFVRFRDSGSLYSYSDFYEWDEFKNTSSLGSYYNKYIKGFYECERLE